MLRLGGDVFENDIDEYEKSKILEILDNNGINQKFLSVIEKYSESQKQTLIDNGTIPDLDFNSTDINTQLKNLQGGENDDAGDKPTHKVVSNGYYWTKEVTDSEEDECKDIDFDDI